MRISNVSSLTRYEVRKTTGNTAGKGFDNTAPGRTGSIKQAVDTTRQTSVLDIYKSMVSRRTRDENAYDHEEVFHEKVLSDEELEQEADQESDTKTQIIVKPDGSRVLVMTMSVGGMKTTMSLEISKPTEAPNENSGQDTDDHMSAPENDIGSDEMSNISDEACADA